MSFIQDGVFQGKNSLTTLDLEWNRISDISEGAFKDLVNVEWLQFDKKVFESFNDLKEFNKHYLISKNEIIKRIEQTEIVYFFLYNQSKMCKFINMFYWYVV